MLENLQGILATAAAVIAIGSLAGIGLQRGTIAGLREQNKDLRDEVADKDRRELAAQQTMATQAADIAALGRVVTGEAHWTALGERLDDHHRQAEQQWAAQDARDQAAKDMLAAIMRELRRGDRR